MPHPLALADPLARFRSYVRVEPQTTFAGSACERWTAATNPSGYGTWGSGLKYGTTQLAHRWIYEKTVGPIPGGLVIDHLCGHRWCVNTAHMEAVPQYVNIMRGVGPTAANAQKTHCKHGHAFTEENTYRKKDGGRACRACQRAVDRRRKNIKNPRKFP